MGEVNEEPPYVIAALAATLRENRQRGALRENRDKGSDLDLLFFYIIFKVLNPPPILLESNRTLPKMESALHSAFNRIRPAFSRAGPASVSSVRCTPLLPIPLTAHAVGAAELESKKTKRMSFEAFEGKLTSHRDSAGRGSDEDRGRAEADAKRSKERREGLVELWKLSWVVDPGGGAARGHESSGAT
ncbi:hypothetical protein NL676_025237 [Syzygium grande]|nr:hypothetical protein NL676_025237 [Syzygium grande]